MTLQDSVTFILTEASEADVSRIFAACRQRTATLRTVAAAAVQVGMATRLDDLSPKYLNGLTGTVTSIKGARCTVELDERSTTRLRYAGRRRFYIPEDAAHYSLTGVPTSSAKAA